VNLELNRTWVFAALALGALVGIVFALFPQWDIAIARLFFDPVRERFPYATKALPNDLRDLADWLVWLILIAAAGAILLKLAFPRWPMLMRPTVAVFLLVSYALGPGLVTNGILKPVWSRARPVSIEQFGGQEHFSPWWEPGGDCDRNCSFVSGDASSLTWLLAPASVAPPAIKPFAFAGAAVIAASLSGMRVVFGRHFFTDVVFGVVVTILVLVFCRWLIFHVGDARIEGRLVKAGFRLRSLLSRGDAEDGDETAVY
jgi:membrane-associated PAP2 superfamily phosphatase